MAAIADRVEAECETELSRLGSEKLLLAATEADIRADTVAATADEAALRLETWAVAAEDEAAAFLAAGETAYRAIHDGTLATWPDAAGEPLVELDGTDGDWERIGAALVGAGLVLDRLLLQAISFHVNEANARAADQLREFRTDVQGVVDRTEEVGEGREDALVVGGVALIEAAYDRYASRLDAMGLDPKPLC